VKTLTRGTSGLVRVKVHKDRPGFLSRPYAANLDLTSDPDTHAITWEWRPPGQAEDADGWQPTVLMTRVADYLALQSEPVSRSTVEGAVRGKSRDWIRRAMDELVSDGSPRHRARVGLE